MPGSEPFTTDWFDYPNNYVAGMVVYDLRAWIYTENGIDWKGIQFDHL